MIPEMDSAPGNTPLHPDDAEKLIPSLATRQELNEWERLNILRAQVWAFAPRIMSSREPVDEIYVRELHRRMFDRTWKWAGKYRDKDGYNIGCPHLEIQQRIVVLLGNVRYWLEHQTYGIDEIAIRFHHQIVGQIHAFPNGNGRHARLLANVLAVKHGRPRFSWGRGNLTSTAAARETYINALRALDENFEDTQPLLSFARS